MKSEQMETGKVRNGKVEIVHCRLCKDSHRKTCPTDSNLPLINFTFQHVPNKKNKIKKKLRSFNNLCISILMVLHIASSENTSNKER